MYLCNYVIIRQKDPYLLSERSANSLVHGLLSTRFLIDFIRNQGHQFSSSYHSHLCDYRSERKLNLFPSFHKKIFQVSGRGKKNELAHVIKLVKQAVHI